MLLYRTKHEHDEYMWKKLNMKKRNKTVQRNNESEWSRKKRTENLSKEVDRKNKMKVAAASCRTDEMRSFEKQSE